MRMRIAAICCRPALHLSACGSKKVQTHRGQLAHAPHAVDVLRLLEHVLEAAQVLLEARHAVPIHLQQQARLSSSIARRLPDSWPPASRQCTAHRRPTLIACCAREAPDTSMVGAATHHAAPRRLKVGLVGADRDAVLSRVRHMVTRGP